MTRDDRDTYKVVRSFLGLGNARTSTAEERRSLLPIRDAEEVHLLANNIMKYTPFLATNEKRDGRIFLNAVDEWKRFDSDRSEYIGEAETLALRPTIEEQSRACRDVAR